MEEHSAIPDGSIRIGVDIGGTFTDFVVFNPASGVLKTFKLLSTPHDPAEAVLEGLASLVKITPHETSPEAKLAVLHIVHGSTVATNALLERKGARTALVATQGFRDVLQIGRQNRPALYDFQAEPPPPLVPASLRFEIDERVDASGAALRSPTQAKIEVLLAELNAVQADSVAICLLFSFLHPNHEKAVAERLRAAGYFVSVSSEILPEYREYERASTTAVNAYVSPGLDHYLARLETASLPGAGEIYWRVMQSNGGKISLRQARQAGVRCILSGPAGGVTGAFHLARLALNHPRVDPANFPGKREPAQEGSSNPVRLITFDMGGTSTDVSLIDGAPGLTTELVVGGCPIRLPVLDIHTIGAGGGSIASLDAGGALRVGPQSAGADPGPACYGRVELEHCYPTVTDANLVLGRLSPEHFLGGELPLDPERAGYILTRLGAGLGLDAIQAALGVIEVANAHMERALRVISVERGHDPRDFILFSFGGAGGLHAADLAWRLGAPQVLVPSLASTLSAFGMLCADVVKDYVQTVMLSGDEPLETLAAGLEILAERGRIEVAQEGVPPSHTTLEWLLDVRYTGQSYELTIPFSRDFRDSFHRAHHREYGYNRPEAPIQVVNLRLRATGYIDPPHIQCLPYVGQDPAASFLEIRPVAFTAGVAPTQFYRGESLQPGNCIEGPAVIIRSDTTILISPGQSAEVDGFLNVLITVGG
ncbi:MAG TPA: hydantoinase/oxoprolinase family protein [Anaerolineales bacterium]|nr:hydantoinase/oxoprolinase family protein [Anaerolineales bacterium]